ncbi:PQQ-dependent sugar dehydrogenase [Streptomyces sp. AC536]|uniref:PQQ-dependent sugar dehydrogenase n=1 Tax=Streptomyces buecherae TaxID=2763006 RepID=UPI00164E4687|nr:PQQ-dependent sugar dehydrogenase [Streptomyces buecherae]MBC3982115.1 PQQ-dependent sugar dehydrogenase [Streptomyces buecherae]QNJ39886.1 PQQ-dependent sugar dehydrogenase [Streptomyces buecherae]
MRRTGVTAAFAAATLLFVSGCSDDGGDGPLLGRTPGTPSSSAKKGGDGPSASPSHSAPPKKGTAKVVATVAQKLSAPWGVVELPDGDLLVALRDEGKVVRIGGDDGKRTELGSVPGASPGGEGGLLGIAVSPTFGADRMLYAYFTTESDNRVARMIYDERRPAGQQLGAPDTILKGIPKGTIHNGGRIAFGPDKMLYVGTGESGDRGLAQDKDSLGGKILRMTPDGEPAEDNPSPDSVVYSYGHRNVQGLAWDKQKRLWAAEFGQDTWDELNLIKPDGNYGWPEVEGRGKDGEAAERGFVDPVEQWKTSEASPSGIAIVDGSVWMAALGGERLWRVPLDGTRPVAEPQEFFVGKYGRLRTVQASDDGTLLLTTSNTDGRGDPKGQDDRVLRLKVS